MSQPNTVQHPSAVDSYIRHGWALVPIPFGTKGPRTPGWNKVENTLKSAGDLPLDHGIGLAHAYSGTMAVDIDDWSRAAFELMMHGIDIQALYDAPDAVIIDSGRQGHGKLLYAMPTGVVLPSKKCIDKRPDGQAYNYLDLRCGTANSLTVQDVLPPSIHPDTRQPYRWAGRGHWTRLPTIPDALLTYWRGMVETIQSVSIPAGTSGQVSWVEIQDALTYVSPDCARKDWITVGMALHWAETQSGEAGLGQSLWVEWSKGSATKYPGDREMVAQWRSFSTDKASVVRLGSLIHMAQSAGWKRPEPDVTTLFSASDAKPLLHMGDISTMLKPAPPDVDVSLFPKVLATRAAQVAREMGSDPLVPLFAGMAAVSGAIDSRSRLELLPRFKVAPVLWCMTIGNPALKKSPASRPMLAPLEKIEIEDRPRYQKDLLDWEAKEVRWAAAKKSFLDFAGSPEAMLDEQAPHVPELPPKPVPVRITVSDVTSQKLVRLAAERSRGILCVLDEMAGWVKKLLSYSSGEDRSAWVVGYEAQQYIMDRVGAGTVHADNFALSIYGNIQPDVFHGSLKEMASDGLLQRFIPAVLRERDWGVGTPLADHETNIGDWEQTLRIAYSLPHQTYRLSAEATEVFREFQHWYNAAKQDEILLRSPSTFMTAFGKLEGTVGRLALVWHVMDAPFSIEVSGDLMRRVIRFAKGYVVPAYRYAFAGSTGERATFQEWLGDYIALRVEKVTLTMSDIKNAYSKNWVNMNVWAQDQLILASMVMFEEAGWVKRTDDRTQEFRHIAEWAINPAILTEFNDHRTQVRKATARRVAETMRVFARPSTYATGELRDEVMSELRGMRDGTR